VHIATELHRRGFAIEYWSQGVAEANLPSCAKFCALHPPENDHFVRFTRTYCNLKCAGDTFEESQEVFEKDWNAALSAEFGSPEKALYEVQGTREALIQMKQRVLGDDVALCIFDHAHMYSWMAQHCADHGVPSLGLYPTQLWLRTANGPPTHWPPSNLTDEPEYRKVRQNLGAVPHRVVYTILPDLLEGCTIPEGQRVVGPVLPGGADVTEEQLSKFCSSGLKAWCDSEDSPIVYVSFGSMARSGPVVDIGRRLVQAISGGPWRLLVAASPIVLEGVDLPTSVRLESWVPQSAVLAHPKVKAFVSHCGATSVNEAVLHAVPLVAMPFFDDQRFNATAAVACGAAVAELSKFKFTAEMAMDAVRTAVESEDAAANARAASERLRACTGLSNVVAEAEAAIDIAGGIE